MKFLIKKNFKKERSHKGTPIFGTGMEYHLVYEDTLYTTRVSKDKIRHRTGLNKEDLNSSPVLTDELKQAYLNNLERVRERIKDFYGEEALDSTNEVFWTKRGNIIITNDVLNTVFDDEADVNALILRYNIAAGGFSDIAPSLEMAAVTGKKYYVVEEEEFKTENFEGDINTKLKANAALNSLYEKGSSDGLLYLTWVVLSETQGFTRNNSKEVIVQALSDFIDGKLVNKDKKVCAKTFLEYANKWKNDKEGLIIEAVFNIAVYYGLIYLADGKYVTKDRNTILGSNKQMAIKILSDVKNIDELKDLKALVDKKIDDKK